MRCRRQGKVSLSYAFKRSARAFLSLLLVLASPSVLPDSASVINPFEIPQGAYQATHVEDVDNISIIEFAGNYDKELPGGAVNAPARAVVAQEFYRTHADDYDFLVVFTDFEFETGDARAFHMGVRNDVQGIGLPQFDLSSLYGSSGKLQSYIDMAALSRYETDPLKPTYERGLLTLAHEFFHRWGVFIEFRDEGGQNNSSLLGRQDAHWSFKVDTDASVQYGHDWKEVGPGKFKAESARRFFSPMDLYLMGFYGPEEVEPFFYIESEDRKREELPQQGVTINGVAHEVTIEDVIAAEGPRIPSVESSQKEFKFAFIYLTTGSSDVEPSTILALKRFRENFVTRLAVLTGGRAVANIYPQAKPLGEVGESTGLRNDNFRATGANVPEALVWLRNAQAGDGFWQDQPGTQLRDTALALRTLTTYDPAFYRVGDAESWLRRQENLDNDSLARRFAARGTQQEREGDLSLLLKRRNSDGGWGVEQGYQSDVMDTALVLRAIAPHVKGEVTSSAVNYLLEHQGADGGWPAVEESASQVTVTALAMDALRKAGAGGEPLLRAVDFLKNHQRADGGFGSDISTVHDTAHVVLSLLPAGQLEQIDVAKAAGYLSGQQAVTGDWNGSVYNTALAIAALQSANFANWVVTDVTANPDTPRDGERVKFTVTVANDGRESSESTSLRVYKGNTVTPENLISGDLAVPSIAPRNAVAVDFYWDSIDQPGASQFTFAVDPDDLVIERSELDNLKSIQLTIDDAPEGIDLELNDGALTVSPASPSYLPADLSVSIAVRNTGKMQADDALVRLLRIEPGQEPVVIDERSITLPPRQTSVVNFVDQLVSPGSTRYQALVDPDAVIEEADESNNVGEALVSPRDTIDFVVNDESISIKPLQAYVGEDVQFTVVLRNQGTLSAPPSSVRYSMVSEGQERELRTNNIVLGAGESVVQTLNWRVDTWGPKQLVVEMDPAKSVSETDETNNRFGFSFAAEVLEGTNVGVAFSDIDASPSPLLEGYGATVTAEVKNNGTQDVTGVQVRFFNGNPSAGGVEIGRTTIGALKAAERASASVVWGEVPDSAEKLIYVQVDPENQLQEFDETDNLAFEKFAVKALPDFVVGEGSLSINPAFPRQGETATVRLDVNNVGIQSAENIDVQLFDADPQSGGQLIGTQSISSIEGQGTGTATFSYQFSNTAQDVRLVALVNADRSIQEKAYNNNRADRYLTIQNNDFHVSERYISPDGDGVKDETRFSFRFQESRTVVLTITNSYGRVVRTITGADLTNATSGSVVWDGRNDFGGVVNDDEYALTVRAENGENLGSATVSVDTNRSSLLAAAGTPYERTTDVRDLISEGDVLRINGQLSYSPNDEFVFFQGLPKDSSDPKGYVDGLYRATAYGGRMTLLVDYASVPELAAGGYVNTGPLVSPTSDTVVFGSPKDIWSVDVEGGAVRHLLTEADLTTDFEGKIYTGSWDHLHYSHDGQWLYFLKDLGDHLELGRVAIDGSGLPQRLTVFQDYRETRRVWPSPSSDSLFAMLRPRTGGYALVHFDADNLAYQEIEDFDYDQPSYDSIAWSPDGHRFAVGDRRFARLQLFAQDGQLIEQKEFFDLDPRFDIPAVRWNANGLELAYEVEREISYGEDGEFPSLARQASLAEDLCDSDSYEPLSGIYLWNTVTGAVERPIAVTEKRSCSGFVGIDGPMLGDIIIEDPRLPGDGIPINDVTPYFVDEQDQFWLYENPRDWEWSPGERRILVRPDNSTEHPDLRQFLVVDIENAGVYEEPFDKDRFGYLNDIEISPSGRRMFLDDLAFESLLNLSIDVRALRSRAAGGVKVSGTASDLNFSHYELDYAVSGESTDWKSVGPDGLIPLVDQDVTTWVPPAPGSYYLRLIGKDHAGNVRQSIQRTSWGEQAALTDLYRDPGYISPNGDGVQDSVQLHMRVLAPTNIALEVFNADDQLIRTIRRSFDLIGAQETITWDGRDHYGTVVSDGQYRLQLGRYKYSVVVDATAPEIALGEAEELLQSYCGSVPCEPIVDLDLYLEYSFNDSNYYRYRLEVERDGGGWQALRSGEFAEADKVGGLPLKVDDLENLDSTYRILVEDLAGNRSVKEFDLSLKRDRAILTAGNPHYRVDGSPQYEPSPLPFATYDDFPEEPGALKFGKTRFRVVESIQASIDMVAVMYREAGQGDSEWREVLVEQFVSKECPPLQAFCDSQEKIYFPGNPGENQFEFLIDTSEFNRAASYQLKAKLVDRDGMVYTTNGVLLTQTSQFGITGMEKADDTAAPSYQVLTEMSKPPFTVFDRYVLISSTQDPRFLNETKLEISEQRTQGLAADESVTLGFFVHGVVPCADYTLKFVLVDEFGNEVVSAPKTVTPGCTEIVYMVTPNTPMECGAEPSRELNLSAGIFEPEDEQGNSGGPADYQVLVWEMLEPGAQAPKVLFTRNNPSIGEYYEFTLDTSMMQEGDREVTVRAIADTGEEFTETFRLPIDHTPPELSVLSPEQGGKVCAIEFKNADGELLRGALVNADILDVGGTAFTYETKFKTAVPPGSFVLDPTAELAANVPLITNNRKLLKELQASRESIKPIRFATSGQPAFAAPARRTLSGNLKALGDAGLVALNGTREIEYSLSVSDFGSHRQCLTGSFYLDASVEGFRTTSTTRIISPQGGGTYDQALIDLTLDEDAAVTVAVHNAVFDSQREVYSPASQALFEVTRDRQLGAGTTELAWDGTDGATTVPDGHYFLVVHARDGCGNTEVSELLVEVDGTPPVVDIAYPQSGSPVLMNVEVVGSVSDLNLVSYRLEYQIAGDASWVYVADGRNAVADSILANWNTFGLKGDLSLRLVARDAAGNEAISLQELNIEERTNLLSRVDLSSLYVSPNADSVLDNTRLTMGFLEPVWVDISLTKADGTEVSQLGADLESEAGEFTFVWNGKLADEPVEDGSYRLKVVARSQEFAGLQQTESVSVIVDTVAPEISVVGIDNGFAQADVRAVIGDLHFDRYTIYKADDPSALSWLEVDAGEAPETAKLVEPFSPALAEEGEYALRLVARDLAGNRTEVIESYVLDFTPPAIELKNPQAGTVTGNLFETLEVEGAIKDQYLKEYWVAYQTGADGKVQELVRADSAPGSELLALVNMEALPEGEIILVVEASDWAGHATRTERSIVIDNTSPQLQFLNLADGDFLTKAQPIQGVVEDSNLESYVVEFVSGHNAANDASWSPIIQGTRQVTGGNVAYLSQLPEDGAYSLRLRAQDKVGHEAIQAINLVVDTTPPAAPQVTSLGTKKEVGIDVIWDPVADIDLDGYIVKRSGERQNSELLGGTTFRDALNAEGSYEYQVLAVDAAGNVSEPSTPKTIRLDWTAPEVALSSPLANSVYSGLVNIRGTAHSEEDFAWYELSIGEGSTPQGWQVLARSNLSQRSTELAQWDTLDILESPNYTLRLIAEDLSGNQAETRVQVAIDNLAPAAPSGLDAMANGSDVSLTWATNSETDLAGYYLFSEGGLVNADTAVIGDMSPYLLNDTAFSKANLPDGTHQFFVYAADSAGNVSESSEPVEVTIESQPPHVIFEQPTPLQEFENNLGLQADTVDRDIATVDFMYRSIGETEWTPIVSASGNGPYNLSWDTSELAYGDYQIRAVAHDVAGNSDAAPAVVDVNKRDLTRPNQVRDLQAIVDGDQVALTWSASSESDLAGYFVIRSAESGQEQRLNEQPLSAPSYADADVGDGKYLYRIHAVDLSDNESEASSPVDAWIYVPNIASIYTPTRESAVTVRGNVPGEVTGSAEITILNVLGTQSLAPINISDKQYQWNDVSLQPGENTVSVSVVDAEGNRSKPATVLVVKGESPEAPRNLTATAEDRRVTLNWAANPEPNIMGYLPAGPDGALLDKMPAVRVSAEGEASSYWDSPADAIDGDAYSYFRPRSAGSDYGNLTVALDEVRLVSEFEIVNASSGYQPQNYDIQVWSGTHWLTVAVVNDGDTSPLTLEQRYLTDRVRMVFRSKCGYSCRIGEFRIYYQPLVSDLSYIADDQGNQIASYTVTAINDLGLESPDSEPAETPVGDVQAPEPVSLMAEVVAEHDVQLSWPSSTSTDAAGYRLYRNGEVLAVLGPFATEYTDTALPNGLYTYYVAVEDSAGNLSQPSNEVALEVSAPVESSPTGLEISALPEGRKLAVAWNHANQNDLTFRVYRSMDPEGPFERLLETGERAYLDEGLTNQQPYYYQVTVADEYGNESAPTPSVQGIPQDSLAPEAPEILAPARAGEVKEMDAQEHAVVGFSEPGSKVAAFLNGVMTAPTQASIELETTAYRYGGYVGGAISPNGRKLIVADSSEFSVFEVRSQREIWFSGGLELEQVSWLSDDEAIGFAVSADGQYKLVSLAVEERQATFVELANVDAYDIEWLSLSRDRSKLVLLVDSDESTAPSGFWVVDVASWTIERTVPLASWGYVEDSMALSPDLSQVVWLDSETGEINSVSLITGDRTSLGLAGSYNADSISWNQAGTAFVYVNYDGNAAIYDLQTSVSSPLGLQVDDNLRSVRWGRAERVLFRTNYGLYEFDLTTSETEELYYNRSYSERPRTFTWSDGQGVIGLVARNSVYTLAPAGRFQLPVITLTDGENQLFALAQDESGNESQASDVSTLIYRQSDNPDLKPELVINTTVPLTGSVVDLELQIANEGEKLAPASTVTVAILDPVGAITPIVSRMSLSPLAAGSMITQFLEWQVPDLAGEYNVIVSVDEQELIAEVSESNNSLIRSVVVASEDSVSMKTSLDNSTYTSQQALTGYVEVINPQSKASYALSVRIEDANGYEVVDLLDRPEYVIPASSVQQEIVGWNTGSIFAGSYEFVAELRSSEGILVSDSRTRFEIDPEATPILAVSANRASYGPNEPVAITAQLANENANSALRELTLQVSVSDQSGTTLFEHAGDVSELNPSDTQSLIAKWNTENTAPGELVVDASLKDADGITLASAANTIMIRAGVPVLPASLTVGGNRPVGTAITPEITVGNAGNSVVSGLQLTLSLSDLSDGRLITSEAFIVDLGVGQSYENWTTFDTTNLPLGQYKVQLTAGYSHNGTAEVVVLETKLLSLFDADAPQVALLSPLANSVVNGGTAKLGVSASDTLSGVAAVEIQIDGGEWQQLTGSMVNFYYDLDKLAEGTHEVFARATDRSGNESVPVSVSFTIDNEMPGIRIEGVEEGSHYAGAVTPVIQYEDAFTVRTRLNGVEFESGTAIGAEGDYSLFAYAEDEAGNAVRRTVNFVLDKTRPTITVEGVADGELYNEGVTPNITISETYPESVEIKLNDNAFENGEVISQDGEYTLSVIARDRAGNTSQESVAFEIDTLAPSKPEVVNLEDGDIVEAGTLLVNGTAEPASVIDLRVDDQDYTTLTDDTGAFTFAGLTLENGTYLFTLVATDRAGNVSEERRLTVTVREKAQLEIVGQVTSKPHVLVWVPEHPGKGRGNGKRSHDNDFDALIELVGTSYDLASTDYQIVRNESEFVSALRSQRFNVLVIGSLKPALGHPLKMSYATELEIRGVVGAGTGLVWINNHTNLFEFWHDVIGARSFGGLPHVESVYLEDSPASTEADVAFAGRQGVRVILTGGLGVGQLKLECKPHWHLWRRYSDCGHGWWKHHKDHVNPALVINKYGAGSVAMFTFNPGDLADVAQARAMLQGATAYAAPVTSTGHALAVVDVEWTLGGTEPGQDLAALQKLGDALELVSVQGGDKIDSQTGTWSLTANGPEQQLASQIRLGNFGDTAVDLAVYEGTIGAGTLLAEGALTIPAARKQSELELGYMDALDAIDYSFLEYWSVHKAIIYAQSAISRDKNDQAQLEWAIWEVKKSLAWLRFVDRAKSAAAIVSGGQLLKHYQALWSEELPGM